MSRVIQCIPLTKAEVQKIERDLEANGHGNRSVYAQSEPDQPHLIRLTWADRKVWNFNDVEPFWFAYRIPEDPTGGPAAR